MNKQIIAYSGTHGTGKSTSALQLATELKIKYPNRSVHTLCDLEAFCPLPLNKETTRAAQSWLFANHLQQLITAIQRFDIVVLDRTLADVVAYTYTANFTDQAESMEQFLHYHIGYYSEIRIKTIKNNPYFFEDGIRASKDDKFREKMEHELLGIYRRLKQTRKNINIYYR